MEAEMDHVTTVDQAVRQRRRRHYASRGRKLPTPFDRRTRVGRRTAALADIFRERIGVDAADPILNAAVERAAQLMALSEAAAARALRADPSVTLDDVVRLSRAADQAVRRLQLDRHKAQPVGPTLSDILKECEEA
jgi:hypothetical protein